MGKTQKAGGKITCMLGKIKHKIFKSKEKVDLKQKFKNVKFYDYTSGKAMYNYFVTHKQAVGICRKVIGPGYIEKVFTNKKMRGTIANIENPGQDTEVVGFILHERKPSEKHIYLHLVCTSKDPIRKGIPVALLLLKELDKYAKSRGYKKLKAHCDMSLIPFYEGYGWKRGKYDFRNAHLGVPISKKL